jgi:hypothetical protein
MNLPVPNGIIFRMADLGVFRHHSPETQRKVLIGYLDSIAQYEVRNMAGKVIETMSGLHFMNKGFEVRLDTSYSAGLFEIARKK